MKTFEEKREELQAAKDHILKEIESVKIRYEAQLAAVDADIAALERAESLLAETNGAHFSTKGSMSVREAIIKALKEANRPLHLDELMDAILRYGIDSDRGTVRARLARSVGKDIKRVSKATYELI